MAITREESIASLRLLVCMAKADGVLHERERALLQDSFGDTDLPDGISLQWLLDEPVDVETVLAQLASDEAREHAYAAVYALACSDGDCSPPERDLLIRIRDTLEIDATQDAHLSRVFLPRHQQSSNVTPTLDAMARAEEVASATRKCAIVSALLGAFPLPGISIATDLVIAGLQVGLARDIGGLWGQQMDTAQAKGVLAGFGVGTGARIALSNLLKVFPGWGSAFGAASAYASSHAVGRVMNSYFESGRGLDPKELAQRFKQAKSEAKDAFAADKAAIDRAQAQGADQLTALQRQLADGTITQDEFERRAAALVG
ncbi:MAG: DUF533 domain-containing protein [Nannocystaceae bacterium]